MSWNNDNVPKIVLDYDDDQAMETAATLAATLEKNGFEGADNVRTMMANAHVEAGKAVNKTANETLKEVTDLMKERQYHSKSGYIGHGNMVSHTKDHVKGNHHEIYTDALANDGYNYSQAFEFGLLTKDYPAHHPYEDTANHLKGKLEENVTNAIKRGFN